MVDQEADGAVKQACFLCPPTQPFAQCVYQMAALYQGVADAGSTQSSVQQEYGKSASNNQGVGAGLTLLPNSTLLVSPFCSQTEH